MKKILFVAAVAIVLLSGCETNDGGLGRSKNVRVTASVTDTENATPRGAATADKSKSEYSVLVINNTPQTMVIGWGLGMLGTWSGFAKQRKQLKPGASHRYTVTIYKNASSFLVFRPLAAEATENEFQELTVSSDAELTLNYDAAEKKWYIDMRAIAPDTTVTSGAPVTN